MKVKVTQGEVKINHVILVGDSMLSIGTKDKWPEIFDSVNDDGYSFWFYADDKREGEPSKVEITVGRKFRERHFFTEASRRYGFTGVFTPRPRINAARKVFYSNDD